EIKASPYFVECGRLFTDDNLRTLSFQRQRRRKPADPAADNGNAWHAPHASRSVCRRWMRHSDNGAPLNCARQLTEASDAPEAPTGQACRDGRGVCRKNQTSLQHKSSPGQSIAAPLGAFVAKTGGSCGRPRYRCGSVCIYVRVTGGTRREVQTTL